MSDIYDSRAWKQFMGKPKQPCDRIGLQGCTDGFQAFDSGTLSFKPIVFSIASLPPALRYKSEFMLLLMLLPSNAKSLGLKKYFDFAARYELNSLFTKGIDGVKVKIFGMSMDTIGRHELLGMQAATGYESACCICRHNWTAAVTGTQCCFAGYRSLLPMQSRGRLARVHAAGETYEYSEDETRPKPKLRTMDYVQESCAVVEALDVPCHGHKSAPLVAKWPGFNWFRYNPPELMHDSKIFVEMLLKTLVGKVANGGFYASWHYDDKHRTENQILGIFKPTWKTGENRPLPWRLTRDQRELLDARVSTLIWPQKVEKLYYNGASFWKKPNRMWKTKRKVNLLYYILPTQLRDQIPAVRKALNIFVWSMRRMLGQVHSYQEAKRMKILPGSRTFDKTQIKKLHAELIMGLSLLSGCLPVCQLNPGMHHFVHFAEFTQTHGLLHLYWMMGFERYVYLFSQPHHLTLALIKLHTHTLTHFTTSIIMARFSEWNPHSNGKIFTAYTHTKSISYVILTHFLTHRYNKYLKNLVRRGLRPLVHLANSAAIDIATSYVNLCGSSLHKYDVRTDPQHNCILKQKMRRYVISTKEVGCIFSDGL